MEISNHEAPNDIENQYIALRTSIGNKLNSLPPLSPLRCIYRVPERLRHGNERAYTPRVVSIGPLHHGKEHLNAMEEHKMRCLQSFLSRTQVSVNYYINKIKNQEARLRSCYAEIIKFDSDQLVEIVLVDAAFIIELFLGNYSQKFQLEDDYIFKSPNMDRDVRPDMQLLENQLPFFIVEDLFYRDKLFSSTAEGPSLIEISYHFFKFAIFRYSTEDCLKRISSSEVEIKHFVDLIRFICLPSKSKVGGRLKTANMPNITEMHQAGVKCKMGSTQNLFDIEFSDGTLVIPQFKVHRDTEVTIRNLAAFEQCHYKQMYITDFVALMKRFLKTPKDVELLVEQGILENFLTDTREVSALFVSFGKGVTRSQEDFFFGCLCDELNTYCRTPWNRWKAILRQNYLNTPWAVTSIVAAAFLLILTLIQTACSIKSVA